MKLPAETESRISSEENRFSFVCCPLLEQRKVRRKRQNLGNRRESYPSLFDSGAQVEHRNPLRFWPMHKFVFSPNKYADHLFAMPLAHLCPSSRFSWSSFSCSPTQRDRTCRSINKYWLSRRSGTANKSINNTNSTPSRRYVRVLAESGGANIRALSFTCANLTAPQPATPNSTLSLSIYVYAWIHRHGRTI